MEESGQPLADLLGVFATTMLSDRPVHLILDQLVHSLVDVLPVDAAGVTLMGAGREPHTMAASGEDALQYESLQSELGEGPCTAAQASCQMVGVPDLLAGGDFEQFRIRALELGLRAVFAFPLRHGEDCIGALDLYSHVPGPFEERTMRSAQVIADVVSAYVVNARERDELRQVSDWFRTSALHDSLTGLPNRDLLRERLEHAGQRSERSHSTLAVLFVDLDRFKDVNDVYGHRAGDELLVAVAGRLRGLVRSGDTVARISGDEFVLLCEDLPDQQLAEALADRVVEALADPFKVFELTLTLSASVGIAFVGPGETVTDDVLNHADEAMYQAKRAGGGRRQLVDLGERARSHQHAQLHQDLRDAPARGEVDLAYQPIVRCADAEPTGVEALLRWHHPEHGPVPPDVTIELAERNDTIIDLGRWVLRRACSQTRRVAGSIDLGLSVNVSARQLLASGFCAVVEDALTEFGFEPQRLTLELTESVFVHDDHRARMVLDELKTLGVNLALDDFGTGYSSLSYLRMFPIDVIKIDRTFVGALIEDNITTAIVASTIDLAHTLGRSVIAEGIETAQQHARLIELGCDACQGFYFAIPASIGDLEQQLIASTTGLADRAAADARPVRRHRAHR